jgi:hypothetical protein
VSDSAMYVPKRNVKDQGEGLRLASAEEGSPGRMKEGKDSCSVYTVETEYDLAHLFPWKGADPPFRENPFERSESRRPTMIGAHCLTKLEFQWSGPEWIVMFVF